LKIDALTTQAAKLSTSGILAVTNKNLIYLDISDDYIHQLFPLLDNKNNLILKPDYFNKYLIGAHISVIYPEENTVIDPIEFGKHHNFSIKHLCTMQISAKTYYVLTVESNSLLELRKKYNLPDKLNFRGYNVEFHITIGTCVLNRI
jgi:hypothetical protein